MKYRIFFTGVMLFNCLILTAQNNNDFGLKASVHVKKLCDFGERTFGTVAESKTIEYIKKEFEATGMSVEIDTFAFRKYHLNDRKVYINEDKIAIKAAFVNHPLNDQIVFDSYCVKSDDKEDINNLSDRVIITSLSNNTITLSKFKPKAILAVDQNVFDTLKISRSEKYKFTFKGNLESDWIKSYNVVATYNHDFPTDSTIVITAHWDSKNGIGAGDNASGTAALIELSKLFSSRLSKLKYPLTFIATGAEELGFIGATSYVLNHSEKIDNCLFNLNIDNISYPIPSIETSNIGQNKTTKDTLQSLLLYKHNESQGFLLNSPEEIYGNHQTNSNSAIRIRNIYEDSMKDMDYEFVDAGCCSGTESRVFDYMGISYIRLGSITANSKGNKANTSEDVYDDSFIENINKSGKIASQILLNINK
jgi:hypothetical protein